jgi:serine protease Do
MSLIRTQRSFWLRRGVLSGTLLCAPLLGCGLAAGAQAMMWSMASTASHPAGYLGIDVRDVAEESVTLLKLHDSRGAEIIQVDHDGPAGKMGLHEHDVVVQVNGVAIDGEEQCRRLLRELGPGHSIVMLISRDGQPLTLSGQMADRTEIDRQAWLLHLAPAPTATPAGPQAPATGLPTGELSYAASDAARAATGPHAGKSFLGSLLMSPYYTGAILERLGSQMASYLGLKSGIGLLVRSIVPNSPAATAGLQAYDIVVRANGQAVNSPSRWAKAVKEAKGNPMMVTVLRDRQEHTLTLVPDPRRHTSLDAPASATGLQSDGEMMVVVCLPHWSAALDRQAAGAFA